MMSMESAVNAPLRAILHVDMDAFYASVEELDHPQLAGKPLIIGGTGQRGVVSTANYPARRYGVHSAMPMARARRLCPRAVVLRPRIARYREFSQAIFAIFRRYTAEVEGLSLDEAFLDVTDSLRLHGELRDVGRAVQHAIYTETRLTASVGMAHNKLLAKLASDYRKPRGRTYIAPEKAQLFLDPLPVGRLWGIGRQTVPKLQQAGILTIGQLRRADPERLQILFPHRWHSYQRLAQGIDQRRVKAARDDKSISRETTFSDDVTDPDRLLDCMQALALDVNRQLQRKKLHGRTVSIKLRSSDFATYSRSRTVASAPRDANELWQVGKQLFNEWCEQSGFPAVRLLGIGVSNFSTEAAAAESDLWH